MEIFLENWSEKVFVIKKVKNTVPWRYVISDLNREEHPTKKKLQKTNQKEFRIEKQSRENLINYMLNGKELDR